MMPFVAEILSKTAPFWEYGNPPAGTVAAGLFFLLLICLGVVADIGLVLYDIKRPVHRTELANRLIARALPGRMALFFFGITTGFYLLTSWLYLLIFPEGDLKPQTVIFQSLFFHLPTLGVLGLLFRKSGLSMRERLGLDWKKIPTRLGLAILFYLAALPSLWFYSELYQIFLQNLGHRFFMQDITRILMDPAPWLVRTSLLFTIVVVAPAFEEIVFRGILLPLFVSRVGLIPGIALLSLLFAGIHGHVPSLLPLFLLSAFLSFAYARTQSLLVPIGMHALFNAVTVVLCLLS